MSDAAIAACARAFGVDLAPPIADVDELCARASAAIADRVARGADRRFALAATRELLRRAGAAPPERDDAPLAACWRDRRARRRGWRVVREHLVVPRLALPDGVRLALLAPSLVSGGWMAVQGHRDLSGVIFVWSPVVLLDLMLIGALERAFGWRQPHGMRRVDDLAEALRASPHDHPWTPDAVRARVGECVARVSGGS